MTSRLASRLVPVNDASAEVSRVEPLAVQSVARCGRQRSALEIRLQLQSCLEALARPDRVAASRVHQVEVKSEHRAPWIDFNSLRSAVMARGHSSFLK